MHLFSEGMPQQTPAPMKDPMIKLCLQRTPTTDVSQLGHTSGPQRRAKVSLGVWVKLCRDGIRRQHFVVLRRSRLWAGGMLVPKLAAWPMRSAPLSAVSPAQLALR
jgi:hypothetical protein